MPVALIAKSRKGEELLVLNTADMKLRRDSQNYEDAGVGASIKNEGLIANE